jgi:hypothetical protein
LVAARVVAFQKLEMLPVQQEQGVAAVAAPLEVRADAAAVFMAAVAAARAKLLSNTSQVLVRLKQSRLVLEVRLVPVPILAVLVAQVTSLCMSTANVVFHAHAPWRSVTRGNDQVFC